MSEGNAAANDSRMAQKRSSTSTVERQGRARIDGGSQHVFHSTNWKDLCFSIELLRTAARDGYLLIGMTMNQPTLLGHLQLIAGVAPSVCKYVEYDPNFVLSLIELLGQYVGFGAESAFVGPCLGIIQQLFSPQLLFQSTAVLQRCLRVLFVVQRTATAAASKEKVRFRCLVCLAIVWKMLEENWSGNHDEAGSRTGSASTSTGTRVVPSASPAPRHTLLQYLRTCPDGPLLCDSAFHQQVGMCLDCL